jgi:hypothetical protein
LQFNIYPVPSGNGKQHSFSDNILSLTPAMLSIKSNIDNDDLKALELIVNSSSYSEESCILGYKDGEVIDSVGIYSNSSNMYYQLGCEQGFDSVHIYSNDLQIVSLIIWNQTEYVQHGEIEFIVTSNGSPLSDALITIHGNELRTDRNGKAQIALPLGDYDYTVTIDSYKTYQGTVNLQEDQSVNIVMEPTSGVGQNKQEMKLYPNPFSAQLTIDNAVEIASVTILNAVGKKVMIFEHNGEPTATIHTENLRKGIFFVQLRTADGQLFTKKIVKHD